MQPANQGVDVMEYLGKILLVEDEESVRYSLELALSTSGYNVITASDGIKGLSWIMVSSRFTDTFDLMIMDVMMPMMNGVLLLNKLKQFKMTIPTLVITGCSDAETLAKLRESGVEYILKKPFEPNEFLAKVEELMSKNPKKTRANGELSSAKSAPGKS
ncbi:MAG: response regulator transcription factor [Nitrospinae bacterium]|nr:response regulator transcription factor [Nitrospinota bacterium]